jgi:hypothetical protein
VSIVSEWLAAQIAVLDKADFPVIELGYGTDLSCLADIDRRASHVTGIQSVIQDCVHKLQTFALPGDEPEDETWGIDLQMYLSRPLKMAEIAQLESQIQSLMLADERIDSLTAKLTADSAGRTIAVTIKGVLKDSSTAFDFVFQLNSADNIAKVTNG